MSGNSEEGHNPIVKFVCIPSKKQFLKDKLFGREELKRIDTARKFNMPLGLLRFYLSVLQLNTITLMAKFMALRLVIRIQHSLTLRASLHHDLEMRHFALSDSTVYFQNKIMLVKNSYLYKSLLLIFLYNIAMDSWPLRLHY